jgi:hypothetical protein
MERQRLVMQLLGLGLIALLAMFAPLLIARIIFLGTFVKWTALPPTPQPALEIVQTYAGGVVIRDADQKLYACMKNGYYRYVAPSDWASATCWVEIDTPEPIRHDRVTHGDCAIRSPLLWPTTSPPRTLNQCVRVRETDIDFYSEFIYVIDRQGTVWRWHDASMTTAYGSMVGLGLMGLSCLAGLMTLGVGVIVVLWLRQRKTNAMSAQIEEYMP